MTDALPTSLPVTRPDAARRSVQSPGGSGLGLAIARGLARAHRGDLTCEPAATGALFRLTLPKRAAASAVPGTGPSGGR